MLAGDDSVEMANRAAERWLDELGAATILRLTFRSRARGRRPDSASRNRGRPRRTVSARARVRTPAGDGSVSRGSLLGDGTGARVAILLEAARPPELRPLIADAYGFTERERLVTELVAQGYSTRRIAGRLHLSAYTVQDHLKTVHPRPRGRPVGRCSRRPTGAGWAP